MMIFVYSMLTTATFGVVPALTRNMAPAINLPTATRN
jgi:hypothetical protein